MHASKSAVSWQAPVFGDVNGDGVLEVVLGSSSGVLFVLSGISGRDVAPFPFRTHGSLMSQVCHLNPSPPGSILAIRRRAKRERAFPGMARVYGHLVAA